jgi:hypothetical protein
LESNGYSAVPIWLGDYISLDDDVAVKDVSKRMNSVINDLVSAGTLNTPFDMIVHSTGGLVVREWLSSYYSSGHQDRPIKSLLMLAPANFGSKLASIGQSMLGRLAKGWNNWFHSGKRMLQNLELSSPYQWDLVKRDLLSMSPLGSTPFIYGNDGVWPFVIVGTHPYTNPLRSILSEEGADGTVRVSAANMNVLGATIDFAKDDSAPDVLPWCKRTADSWTIPFAVLPDHDHATITVPANGTQLGNLILQALACDNLAKYQNISTEWDGISEQAALLGLVDPANADSAPADGEKAFCHQFIQVNVHVIDDHGEDVTDYFLEFFGPPDLKSDKPMAYFHNEVLKHVHINSQNPSYRCLYVDRTDLYKNFYAIFPNAADKQLWMSISATPLGNNVSYFNNYKTGAKGQLQVHAHDDGSLMFRLRRNTTHFIEIIIPRTPSDNVFRLAKY